MRRIYVWYSPVFGYVAELFHNGRFEQWAPLRAMCMEHAEAEAADRYRMAESVNGLSLKVSAA